MVAQMRVEKEQNDVALNPEMEKKLLNSMDDMFPERNQEFKLLIRDMCTPQNYV